MGSAFVEQNRTEQNRTHLVFAVGFISRPTPSIVRGVPGPAFSRVCYVFYIYIYL